MIIEKKIKGSDIFFTEEKKFSLYSPPNKQKNQIRLNSKGENELRAHKRNYLKNYKANAKILFSHNGSRRNILKRRWKINVYKWKNEYLLLYSIT